MYIIDIPSGESTGPSSASPAAAASRAAELMALAKRKPPLVEVSVNGDEAIVEAVHLLRSARTQMELLTNTINERFNVTFVGVGDQVGSIVSNINTITDNIAHSSSNLNQPVLFMLFMCVFLLIFIVVLLFCILRTRREFKKRKLPYRSATASPAPAASASGIAAARKHNRGGGFAANVRRKLADSLRPRHDNSAAEDYRHQQPPQRNHHGGSREALRKASNTSARGAGAPPEVSMDPAASVPPMSASTSTAAAAVAYSNAPTILKKKTSMDSLV